MVHSVENTRALGVAAALQTGEIRVWSVFCKQHPLLCNVETEKPALGRNQIFIFIRVRYISM